MRGILLLLIAFAQPCVAQNWCPTGAHWYHEELTFSATGYRYRTCLGDELVGGWPAQRFHTTGIHVTSFFLDTTWVNFYQYTYTQDSIVYVPSNLDPSFPWDTLMRLDAVPGDHWFPPNHWIYCGASAGTFGMWQIADTGHAVVSGAPLRWWDANVLGQWGLPVWTMRYYERLGWINGFVPFPACAIVENGEVLRCYSDNQILWSTPGAESLCDISLGLLSGSSPPGVPYPNPGNDHFTLSLPPGPHSITLIDATGRTVLQVPVIGSPAVIGTTQVTPGLYMLRVDEGLQPVRWVKE